MQCLILWVFFFKKKKKGIKSFLSFPKTPHSLLIWLQRDPAPVVPALSGALQLLLNSKGGFPRVFGVCDPAPMSCGCCGRRRGRGGQLAQRSKEGGVLWFGSRDMKGWLVSSFPSRFITRQQDFHRSSRQQDRFFRQTGSSKGSSSQHK